MIQTWERHCRACQVRGIPFNGEEVEYALRYTADHARLGTSRDHTRFESDNESDAGGRGDDEDIDDDSENAVLEQRERHSQLPQIDELIQELSKRLGQVAVNQCHEDAVFWHNLAMERFDAFVGMPKRSLRAMREVLLKEFSIDIKNPLTQSRIELRNTLSGIIDASTFPCCPMGCMTFTGDYAARDNCAACGREQYDSDGKPKGSWQYIPLIPRLILQYSHAQRAQELAGYRDTFHPDQPRTVWRDVFDGDWYRECWANGYFRDPHNIALRISLDGIGLVNTPRQSQTVTPVVIYNLNLHPTDRNEASNALTVIIPGSPKSEFMDTWLHPLMQELRLLQLGIHGVYDGYTKRPFMLRAHPILVTGDGKAIAQIMGTKSPGGAQKGCRMCELVGVQDNNSTFYYPSGGNLNPEPYNHQRDVIEAVHARQASITLAAVAKMKKLTGISRRSTLLDVPTIHFPRSFPLDTMHCMSQNIPKLLMRMWRGLLFPNRNMPWVLTEGQWQAVNYSLAQSRSLIPTHVGTAPQNTATCMNWTSSEYHTFLTIYGAPALKANLPQLYGINLMRYRHILRLADKKIFTEAEIQDLRSRVGAFVQDYERIYFGNIAQQLRVCTIQIHYLLHLADNIRDFGSPVNFSQWALERFLRDIKHLARSPSLKYTSITINLLDLERRRHANFATSLPITTSYKHTQTGQPPLLLEQQRATRRAHKYDHHQQQRA